MRESSADIPLENPRLHTLRSRQAAIVSLDVVAVKTVVDTAVIV